MTPTMIILWNVIVWNTKKLQAARKFNDRDSASRYAANIGKCHALLGELMAE